MKVWIFDTDKKYNVIYADPPWNYGDKQNSKTRGGAIKGQSEKARKLVA